MNPNFSIFTSKIHKYSFLLLVIYYILINTTPLFLQITNARISFLVLLLLTVITFFLIGNLVSILILLFPFFIYIVIQLLGLYFSGSADLLFYIYRSFLFVIPPFIGFYLIKSKDKKILSFILFFTIFMYLITAITSIYGLIQDPLASRLAATIGSSDNPYLISINMRNIAGFEIVYVIALLSPIVLTLKTNAMFRYMILFIFFLFLIYTQYFIALFIYVAGAGITIFTKKKKLFYGVAIFGIILYMLLPILVNSFDNSIFTVLFARLQYLINLISGNFSSNSDLNNRLSMMLRSLDNIINSPLLGQLINLNFSASGHSFILDSLEKFGLLFGLPLLYLIYFSVYSIIMKINNRRRISDSSKIILFTTLTLSILNPINNFFVLGFILPIHEYLLYRFQINGKES